MRKFPLGLKLSLFEIEVEQKMRVHRGNGINLCPSFFIASKPPLDPSIFHFPETAFFQKILKRRETLQSTTHVAPRSIPNLNYRTKEGGGDLIS